MSKRTKGLMLGSLCMALLLSIAAFGVRLNAQYVKDAQDHALRPPRLLRAIERAGDAVVTLGKEALDGLKNITQ